MTISIGLGGNAPETPECIAAALEDLGRLAEPASLRSSRWYRTKPLHVYDQPDYWNLVVQLKTGWSPSNLLPRIHQIEHRQGRDRSAGLRFGPRPLDLDILLVDEVSIVGPDLIIPHPRMTIRAFVLQPLLDLEPRGHHPVTGRSWESYMRSLPDQDVTVVSPPFNR